MRAGHASCAISAPPLGRTPHPISHLPVPTPRDQAIHHSHITPSVRPRLCGFTTFKTRHSKRCHLRHHDKRRARPTEFRLYLAGDSRCRSLRRADHFGCCVSDVRMCGQPLFSSTISRSARRLHSKSRKTRSAVRVCTRISLPAVRHPRSGPPNFPGCGAPRTPSRRPQVSAATLRRWT